MSNTPLFDEECARHPEVEITVHEENVELYKFGFETPLRKVCNDRLEFNFNEPYRGVSPYTHPSMPGTAPMAITTQPQDWSPLQRPLAFGESA